MDASHRPTLSFAQAVFVCLFVDDPGFRIEKLEHGGNTSSVRHGIVDRGHDTAFLQRVPKSKKFGEIRFGGLVGYSTDGEQRISDGAYFDADVGKDFALTSNASRKPTFQNFLVAEDVRSAVFCRSRP